MAKPRRRLHIENDRHWVQTNHLACDKLQGRVFGDNRGEILGRLVMHSA